MLGPYQGGLHVKAIKSCSLGLKLTPAFLINKKPCYIVIKCVVFESNETF